MGTSRTFASALILLCATAAPVAGCGSCHDAPASFGSAREPARGGPGGGDGAMTDAARGDAGTGDTGTGDPGTGDTDTGDAGEEQRAALPPLPSAGRLVSLPVPGFGDAVVSVPRGARSRKPVMLAIHGNYDRPDFQCGLWRSMVRDGGFILCPRGVPRRDSPGPDDIRFTYEGKFASELDAALAALQERYGAWIDPGPMTYIGFSLGAILARSYVTRSAATARFDRLILIEGGASGWDARAASKAGVQRMLWACGQAPCADAGRTAAAPFERAKVPSKVVHAKGQGHTYGGAVAEAIRAEWDWLIEGDPRWTP